MNIRKGRELKRKLVSFLFAFTHFEKFVRIASISKRAMARGFSKFFFGRIATAGRAGQGWQHFPCGAVQPHRLHHVPFLDRKIDPASGRGSWIWPWRHALAQPLPIHVVRVADLPAPPFARVPVLCLSDQPCATSAARTDHSIDERLTGACRPVSRC